LIEKTDRVQYKIVNLVKNIGGGKNMGVKAEGEQPIKKDKYTMVVFSQDFDKVISSFIIATGAAAMESEVVMFFTFWGINTLRDPMKKGKGKNFVEKMFGIMMPKGVGKLKLSKMNMGGMGTSMMKKIMKKKNVVSLESLVDMAKEMGVKLVVCQMSMDLMGIKKEELIDGVEIGGVAAYLGEANDAKVNLFI
jgi:peroxiredoxin family protein